MRREGEDTKEPRSMKKGDEDEETEVEAEKEQSEQEEEENEKDKKIKELTSTLQYLQAEYENYKKRAVKDLENVLNYSNEGLIQKLLPVLDDFEASLDSIKDEKILEGSKLIHENLKKVLYAEGLEEIKALGESFDPFKHEAVLEVDDPERDESEIVEVVQKGYILKSKVIRPSKVKVVKHHSEEDKEVEENG